MAKTSAAPINNVAKIPPRNRGALESARTAKATTIKHADIKTPKLINHFVDCLPAMLRARYRQVAAPVPATVIKTARTACTVVN